MASLLIPLSLLVVGAVFTAGHVAFNHVGDDAALRRMLRVGVYVGLIAVLTATEEVVSTALWVGIVPSLGLASHVWFCRKHRLC